MSNQHLKKWLKVEQVVTWHFLPNIAVSSSEVMSVCLREWRRYANKAELEPYRTRSPIDFPFVERTGWHCKRKATLLHQSWTSVFAGQSQAIALLQA